MAAGERRRWHAEWRERLKTSPRTATNVHVKKRSNVFSGSLKSPVGTATQLETLPKCQSEGCETGSNPPARYVEGEARAHAGRIWKARSALSVPSLSQQFVCPSQQNTVKKMIAYANSMPCSVPAFGGGCACGAVRGGPPGCVQKPAPKAAVPFLLPVEMDKLFGSRWRVYRQCMQQRPMPEQSFCPAHGRGRREG